LLVLSIQVHASPAGSVNEAGDTYHMRIAPYLIPAFLVTLLAPAGAQEKKDAGTVYKVEFRIRDGSAATAKTPRRYTMLIDTTGHGSFRVGDRVPVATGGSGANMQFTYLDEGVNIDTQVYERGAKVVLASTLDISALTQHKTQPGSPVLPNPTVAQVRIVVNAAIVPGKPTLVASIDDPVTERKFDVEALVTKVE
jgi:hypothetical protein